MPDDVCRAIGTLVATIGGVMASMGGGEKTATTNGPVPVTEDPSIRADSRDEEDL